MAGVLVYNRWQEARTRREAQRAFGSSHADVLVAEPRRAPPLGQGASADERIDYVIGFALAPGADAELREGWRPIEQRFAGRALLGDGQAALQLVSRAGVVSDAELLEFRSAVETLAAAVASSVSAPEMRAALEAARALDRLCAEVDIEVALHVVGIGTREVALEGPFKASPRDDGVTLTLDVARTRQPARAYEAMARAGRHLAAEQGGRVVDDTGRELDERALAAIGAQLEAVSQRLLASGIEPGSPLALRLFS